jgi:DNA repair photolyase
MMGEEELEKLYQFALKLKPELMRLLSEKAPNLMPLYEQRYASGAAEPACAEAA